MSELSVGSLSGLAANSYVISVAPGSSITGTGVGGFTASATITATDASWAVPTLGSSVVKVTAIGGGGGGGAAYTCATDGATGGTTTFNAGGAGTVTANGGLGGMNSNENLTGDAGPDGFVSMNGGGGGSRGSNSLNGQIGFGGYVTVAYLDMTGITTANVTIGAGGAGGTGNNVGGAGGDGVVIVEYVAG